MKLLFDLTELMVDSSETTNQLKDTIVKMQEVLSSIQVLTGMHLSSRHFLQTGLRPEDNSPQIGELTNPYQAEKLLEQIGSFHTQCMNVNVYQLMQIYSKCIFQYLLARGIVPAGAVIKADETQKVIFNPLFSRWEYITDILLEPSLAQYVSGFGMYAHIIPNHKKTIVDWFLTCRNSIDRVTLLTNLKDRGGVAGSLILSDHFPLYEDSTLQKIIVNKEKDVLFMFNKLPNLGLDGILTFRFTRKLKETIPLYGLELSVDKHSIIQEINGDSVTITNNTPHFLTVTVLSGSNVRVALNIPRNHIPYLFVIDGQSFPMSSTDLTTKGISFTKTEGNVGVMPIACYQADKWILMLTNFTKSTSIHIETCEDATMKRPRAIISNKSTLSIREDLIAINIQTLFPLVWLDRSKVHITAIRKDTPDSKPEKVEVEDFDVSVDKFLYTETCITTTLPYPKKPSKHECGCHPSYPNDFYGHNKPPKKNNPWTPDFPGRMNPNPTVIYDPPTGFSCIKMHPYSPSDKCVSFHIASCSGISLVFSGYEMFDQFVVSFDDYAMAINLNAGDRGQRYPHIIIPAIKSCKFTTVDSIPDEPMIPPVEDYPPEDIETPDKDNEIEGDSDTDNGDTGDSTEGTLQTKVILAGKLSYAEGSRMAIIRTMDNVNKMVRLKAPLPNRYSGEDLVYDDTADAKLIQIAKLVSLVVTFADGKEITEWVDDNADTDFPIVISGRLMYFPATQIIVITVVDGKNVTTNNFYLKNPLPTKPDGSSVLDTETTGKVIMIGTKQAVLITNGSGEEFFEWITNPIDVEKYTHIETRDIVQLKRIPGKDLIYATYGGTVSFSMILKAVHPLVGLLANDVPHPVETIDDMMDLLLDNTTITTIEFCSDKDGKLHAIFYNEIGSRVDTTIEDVYTGACTRRGIITELVELDPGNYCIKTHVNNDADMVSVTFDLPYGSDYHQFSEYIVPYIDEAMLYRIVTSGMVQGIRKDWIMIVPSRESTVPYIAEVTFFQHKTLKTLSMKFHNVIDVYLSTNGTEFCFNIENVPNVPSVQQTTRHILNCKLINPIIGSSDAYTDIMTAICETDALSITEIDGEFRYLQLRRQGTNGVVDSRIIYTFKLSNETSAMFYYNSIGENSGNTLLDIRTIGSVTAFFINGFNDYVPKCILTQDKVVDDIYALLQNTELFGTGSTYVDYAYETEKSTNGIMVITHGESKRCIVSSLGGMRLNLDTPVVRNVNYDIGNSVLSYLEYKDNSGVVCGIVVNRFDVLIYNNPVKWIQRWIVMDDNRDIYALNDHAEMVLIDSTIETVHDIAPIELGVCTKVEQLADICDNNHPGSTEFELLPDIRNNCLGLWFADGLQVHLKLSNHIPEHLLSESNVTTILLEEIASKKASCIPEQHRFVCLQVGESSTGYVLEVDEILNMFKPEIDPTGPLPTPPVDNGVEEELD